MSPVVVNLSLAWRKTNYNNVICFNGRGSSKYIFVKSVELGRPLFRRFRSCCLCMLMVFEMTDFAWERRVLCRWLSSSVALGRVIRNWRMAAIFCCYFSTIWALIAVLVNSGNREVVS